MNPEQQNTDESRMPPDEPRAPEAPPSRAPAVAVDDAQISEEMNAHMEAAMRGAGIDRPPPKEPAHGKGVTPMGGPRPAPIRGPRVVQAGREHRTGMVVSVGPSDVFVEFGPKELGVVAREQWRDGEEVPAVGSQFEVTVDRFESNEGLFICSRPGAVRKADWEALEPGQVVEGRVTAVNKGGLEMEVAGHSAFMPAGQVSLDRVEDLSVYIGEKFPCVVQRVDRRGRGNIILSRRELLTQERKEKAEKLWGTLEEGQVVEGVVRKIMPFGAFVDLGGVDGLVHLNDLSHERVNHGERNVARHVKEGERVRVQVLKVEREHNRIGLGMKQVQADPFAEAANEIQDGAEVSGRVTNITEFGAFVELAPGVEGLVHISELAWRRVGKVEEVLKKDEIVRAKILKIDRDTRRISLSIKALSEPPAQPADGGGGRGGRGKREPQGRSIEEIKKESPSLRRLREKFGKSGFKGGIA